MDVTLTINGRDFSPRLSTYQVTKEIALQRGVTTLDGAEHFTQKYRDIITFSLFPFSDDTSAADYAVLSAATLTAVYTDSATDGAQKTTTVRLASNLESAFGLRSIDGNRYYKGGEITLRAVGVNNA